ncbi:hypothetical protein GF325_05890 [Candidatus Bathyarchaeota archaeon]|nr:hypothetical protein [Candidatus Bathyarchaeota archaeon]
MKSLYIIKNGLPVFKREFSSCVDESVNETLVSGFLSALSSFMDDIKNFGSMKELKTSSDLKFSFKKVSQLLFVTCTDASCSQEYVEAVLERISTKFLEIFSKHIFKSTIVNQKHYKSFNAVLTRDFLSQDLRKGDILEKISTRGALIPRLLHPMSTITNDFYVKGDMPDAILPLIDGTTTIHKIARMAGMQENKIHSFLKYLVKEGVVALKRACGS